MTIVVALVVASCAGVDPKVVNGAVDDFHQQFNADEWAMIYDGADASFRAATPRDTFLRAMTAFKSKAGSFQKAEQRSYVVQAQAGENAGTHIRVAYASTFAQKTVAETFAWRVEGTRVFLASYDAQ